ncbi:MAG: hypothetical protein LLG00_07900 [Planctomycetaceae bacterium]|nr:hypothetical protein [Planctomycetaceae bacterium]
MVEKLVFLLIAIMLFFAAVANSQHGSRDVVQASTVLGLFISSSAALIATVIAKRDN